MLSLRQVSDEGLQHLARMPQLVELDLVGGLNKIYLLREYQRLGLGRRLVGHVARRFLTQGITSMWLFGDARNPSCHAWVALGALKTDADPGSGNYGWRDLRVLAERCPIE